MRYSLSLHTSITSFSNKVPETFPIQRLTGVGDDRHVRFYVLLVSFLVNYRFLLREGGVVDTGRDFWACGTCDD